MTMQPGQRNGRISNNAPNNPTIYPLWAQHMIHRVIQLSKRPDEYIIVFTVHDDGRKEMDIMHATRPSEQLGK